MYPLTSYHQSPATVFINIMSALLRLLKVSAVLLLVGIFGLTHLNAQQKLSYTVDSFSSDVISNNLQVQINKIEPEQLYKNYLLQKSDRVPHSFNVNLSYSPFFLTSPVVGSLSAAWQANFLTGTTLSLGFSGQHTKPSADENLFVVGTPEVTLRQSFLRNSFINNQIRKELYPALYNARASEENTQHLVATTLFNALTTYHQYLVNQELITLLERDQRDVASILRFNKRKSRLGALRESDLLSSEILNIEAGNALINARTANERLKNNLILFLGKSPKDEYEIVLTDSIPLAKPEIDKTIISQAAITNRRDYKALMTQLASARNSLAVSKFKKLPTLDLEISTSLLGTGSSFVDSFGNINAGSGSNYNVNIGLNFGFRTDGRWYRSVAAGSEREVIKTELQLLQLKENIEAEIENILIVLEQNHTIFTKNKRLLDLTQNRYRMIRKDYYEGIVDFTTNVNVKRELINARSTYLNSKLMYEISLLEFQYLTGQFHDIYNIDSINNPDIRKEKIKQPTKRKRKN
ncbi:hypothetical protein COTS27_00686 [Spirochaetota bacterium]|nr:hypothetical protein COTS27_00686 [Spirochaetota bacterium]